MFNQKRDIYLARRGGVRVTQEEYSGEKNEERAKLSTQPLLLGSELFSSCQHN